MRYTRVIPLLAVVLISTACGSLGFGQLSTITSTVADGVGDTAAAAPPTVYDVTRVVSRRIDNPPFGSYDTIQVEVTFNQTVVLPPPGGSPGPFGAELAFDLGFNTDLSTGTGTTLGCGSLGTWNGVDYVVLGQGGSPGARLGDGNYLITDAGLFPTGEASVSLSGAVLTVTVPLSAMGNDDGQTHLYTFAGNGNGGILNTTDCAPNPTGAVVTSPRGTPKSGVGR
ncbi:MAG TPA: hypothetical protein VI007_01965 [bacterium]